MREKCTNDEEYYVWNIDQECKFIALLEEGQFLVEKNELARGYPWKHWVKKYTGPLLFLMTACESTIITNKKVNLKSEAIKKKTRCHGEGKERK